MKKVLCIFFTFMVLAKTAIHATPFDDKCLALEATFKSDITTMDAPTLQKLIFSDEDAATEADADSIASQLKNVIDAYKKACLASNWIKATDQLLQSFSFLTPFTNALISKEFDSPHHREKCINLFAEHILKSHKDAIITPVDTHLRSIVTNEVQQKQIPLRLTALENIFTIAALSTEAEKRLREQMKKMQQIIVGQKVLLNKHAQKKPTAPAPKVATTEVAIGDDTITPPPPPPPPGPDMVPKTDLDTAQRERDEAKKERDDARQKLKETEDLLARCLAAAKQLRAKIEVVNGILS